MTTHAVWYFEKGFCDTLLKSDEHPNWLGDKIKKVDAFETPIWMVDGEWEVFREKLQTNAPKDYSVSEIIGFKWNVYNREHINYTILNGAADFNRILGFTKHNPEIRKGLIVSVVKNDLGCQLHALERILDELIAAKLF